MGRFGAIFAIFLLVLAGCTGGTSRDSSGIYRISDRDRAEIQYRVLDSVNYLRQSAGAAPLTLDARLTSAAQTQANDMSRQQRAWPFGSDGSNPYERVARSGYGGSFITEMYSQSYETELETVTAWMQDKAWGPALLDPDATDMGFAWRQDSNGLTWWALTLGQRGPVLVAAGS